MKIDCISDLHGEQPELSGGDLLIVAGDLTARDRHSEYLGFFHWLANTKYKQRIVIAGNHDGVAEYEGILNIPQGDFLYLEDSGTEYEGIKIWGSPWTPTFYNWHFMKNRGEEIRKQWDLIPQDTEILITHGPPFGLCDQVSLSSKSVLARHAGCEELRKLVETLPNLKLHVFGHIHEGYGTCTLQRPGYGTENNVLCVNACIMDADYNPTNKPITIHFDKHKGANVVL